MRGNFNNLAVACAGPASAGRPIRPGDLNKNSGLVRLSGEVGFLQRLVSGARVRAEGIQ